MNTSIAATQRPKIYQWLLHFFLINLLVVYCLSFHYLYDAFPLHLYEFTQGAFHSVNRWSQIFATIYLIITFFSYFPLLIIASLFLPFVIATLTEYIKCSMSLAVIILSVLVFTLLIDSYVFSIYHFHLNSTIFEMLFSESRQEVFYLSLHEWFIFYGAIVTISLFETGFAVLLWRTCFIQQSQWILRVMYIAIVFSILSAYTTMLPIRGLSHLNQLSIVFPFYNDLHRLLFASSKEQSNDYSNSHFYTSHSNVLLPLLQYPRGSLSCLKPTAPPNIFIILIDSWRFDAMNEKITPALAKFAADNLVFQSHISGGNATKPGVFSLFYGLPANYWEAMKEQRQEPVLMRQLIEDHYQLGIFASASLAIPDFASVIFNQVPNLQVTVPGRNSHERDQAVTQRMNSFLQNHEPGRPLFSFIFYDAVHAYCEPNNRFGLFQPTSEQCNRFALQHSREELHNRYLNAVHFVDTQIDSVFQSIKDAQLWDNSIIIISADHGEEFDDNQLHYWGHTSNFTKYQTQVPLLIHWPGKPHQVYQYPTTHYDIVPSLMDDALSCHAPYVNYSQGLNLLDSKPRYPILISNNDGIAYITSDTITILPPSGGVIIQDTHAQRLVDQTPGKKEFSKALQKLNQFLAVTR